MSKQISWRELCQAEAERRATAEARARFALSGGAPIPFNYRWEHVQQVAQLGLWLAGETGADREIVEAAAWLHDIRKSEPDHGRAGAVAAELLLRKSDFPADKLPAVVDAISRHVGLTRPPGDPPLTPLETAVVWDADKLTKLGVGVLAYNLSLRQFDGLTLDERRRELAKFTRKVLSATVASMNTAPARQLAEARYRVMTAFLEEWESEDRV